jgi:hypothetical protein
MTKRVRIPVKVDHPFRMKFRGEVPGRSSGVRLFNCMPSRELDFPLGLSPELVPGTPRNSGMIVVTRNVADFAPIKVQILNPWEG